MLDGVLAALAWFGRFSDPLAWLVVATFTAGAALSWRESRFARPLTVTAWVLFGVFWLSVFHHFAFVQKSFIEGIGTLVAVPASLYAGLLLARGRDSLFVLSRAIAAMGLIFFPFETLPLLKEPLIETVTRQTAFLIDLVGVDPTVVSGTQVPTGTYPDYQSTFWFVDGDHTITYTILIACTGIGSMAIFGGLIAATDAPLGRKLRALAVSLPVIYGLNLVRNVFIAVGFGTQRFHFFPDTVMSLFGSSDPYKVSYFIADRMLAQSLSVVAMVAITWVVIHELPEIMVVIEDVLYMATGTEYDLQRALGVGMRETRSVSDGTSGRSP
ncbi:MULTISPECIES: archaeosortase A [Halococcus]|uniref:Cytochrome oxidase subunit I-like protein n=1 Tax=Halococcus salifodinae DSM 8989 TaxID=1227456 RepID=M0N7P1_9EURY|nr:MULTISPECIES: archaeosortase A [Halococcus]EMA52690.1 cytochrome oxidase subunit I-like protein [Halococcus salifodinae DSM 8989]